MTRSASARARAAHFCRQQDDSRGLLAGMAAEREIRAAAIAHPGRSAAEVLADLAAAVDRLTGAAAP